MPATDRKLDRRRQLGRLARLKSRFAMGSALGFAALFGLAASHHVGSGGKQRVTTVPRSPVRAATPSTTFFDARDGGYSFRDPGPSAQSSAPQAPASSGAAAPQAQSPAPAAVPQAEQPPVAQSSGS